MSLLPLLPRLLPVPMSTALECFRRTHPAEPTLTQRIGLGVPLVFTTVLSFILNILLLIIVLRSTIVDRNFGLHVVSLIVASLVYLMANTLALIPTTVAHVHYGDPWNAILSCTDNLGYLALMFTTTNVAADRFLLFFQPKMSERNFRQIFFYESKLVILSKTNTEVFQFSFICALQFASSACFYVLPPLMPNNDLAFHLPMIISTLNTLTNPCVMMIFQHKVRTTYWLMIKRRSIAVTAPTSVVRVSRHSKHTA
ncbi:unnamed protein product [Heligmosomoides polygyrus]|uniref:7TM_GPCR_Srx domain-containing protein n=1 Tax=Heligmosomoides polygyrus TaxID=6339 RepID=A0A3P8AZN6_HELPZ|nr:unnamed protein product [Heligmosomoides polygyrus]